MITPSIEDMRKELADCAKNVSNRIDRRKIVREVKRKIKRKYGINL
jgi:hypothetical protein